MRRIHRMPLSTCRRSFQGRPRPSGQRGGIGIYGSTRAHFALVRSIPRIKHSPSAPSTSSSPMASRIYEMASSVTAAFLDVFWGLVSATGGLVRATGRRLGTK